MGDIEAELAHVELLLLGTEWEGSLATNEVLLNARGPMPATCFALTKKLTTFRGGKVGGKEG